MVGVSICEDVWAPGGPVAELGRAGAQVVVNMNASPYSRGRRAERLSMLVGRAAEAGCPLVYVNQVGGQDELVFDGASLVVGADGLLLAAGRQFGEDLVVVDVPLADPGRADPHRRGHRPTGPSVRRPRARPRPATPARRRGRGLRGAGAGHPRLPGQERIHRRGGRALGRDRLVPGGRGGRRRHRPRPSHRARHALALLEPRVGQRRRGPGRTAGHHPAPGPDRAGPHRLRRPPGPGAWGSAGGAGRREPPVACARRAC